MNNIYSVSDLTDLLRKTFAERFPFVWVRGEVSGASRSQPGHIYFNLKDERAQLQCVWFARRQHQSGQKFDPLTGEVYEHPPLAPTDMVRNGAELLCAGQLDVYAQRGQYQLLVEIAQPAGAGLLALEFEQRKTRLAALGYFAISRKRSLPHHPSRIALITSSQGAAIHDFLKISRDRGLASQIRLFPVQVQGQGAAEKMAETIDLVNRQNWAEVIVLIRGGGSMEDLWAFNEECLAKAVFESRIPVLAGVGHEVDFTLTDMTADVRAATPTEAAQLLWLPRHELWQNLDSQQMALDRCLQNRMGTLQKQLDTQLRSLRFFSPIRRLERMQACLENRERQLKRQIAPRLEAMARRLKTMRGRLELAIVQTFRKADERIEKDIAILSKARELRHKLTTASARLSRFEAAVTASINASMTSARFAYTGLYGRLRALNPSTPLKKGYVMLYDEADALIKNVGMAPPGSNIYAMLHDGMLVLNVEACVEKPVSLSGTDNNENSIHL